MLSLRSTRKLAGALAIFALCGLTVGCDDDNRDHRPRHTERHDERHDHRPSSENRRNDEHHRRDRRDGSQHRRGDQDGNRQRQRGDEERRRDGQRRQHTALAGFYRARDLNDAVAAKGTTVPVEVVQREAGSLVLVLPTGQEYPIRFDAATGTGAIAGGNISLREDGVFLFEDARHGVWLVERE